MPDYAAWLHSAELLVRDGRADRALTDLLAHPWSAPTARTWQLLLARWQTNERDYQRGTLTTEQYTATRNRITEELLTQIDAEQARLLPPDSPTPAGPPDDGQPILSLLYHPEATAAAERLYLQFALLAGKGRLHYFDLHRSTGAGSDRDAWVRSWIDHSTLVLCLLSPAFVLDTLAWAEYAQQQRRPLVPILLEEVDLDLTPFAGLVSLPRQPRTVAEWPSLDAAFADIGREVKAALQR